MGKPLQNSLWFKHGEEIIAMLREGVEMCRISADLNVAYATLRMAVTRHFDRIGIPTDGRHDRRVLFALQGAPLQQEIERLRGQLAEDRCPFPDLHCPHLGRHR